MSSTISLFQRNNLPNTKIRSEKTFFPPANFLFIHPFKSLLKLPPFPSPGNKRQTWTREKTSPTGNLRFRFDDTPPRIYGGRFAWTGWKIRFHVVSSNYVDSIRGWRIVLFPTNSPWRIPLLFLHPTDLDFLLFRIINSINTNDREIVVTRLWIEIRLTGIKKLKLRVFLFLIEQSRFNWIVVCFDTRIFVLFAQLWIYFNFYSHQIGYIFIF